MFDEQVGLALADFYDSLELVDYIYELGLVGNRK